jgi:hypothetical protein
MGVAHIPVQQPNHAGMVGDDHKISPENFAGNQFRGCIAIGHLSQGSGSKGSSVFIAQVLRGEEGRALVEMRNRFKVGETLEILSANPLSCGKRITVQELTDENGAPVTDAKLVQQKLWLTLPCPLTEGDILMADAK